jgi:putative membrane protein
MLTKDNDMPDARPRKKHKYISTQITNHLANERTFLAWIRTGLATISIGFVVARFGLFLREVGLSSKLIPDVSLHYSSVFGLALSIMGVVAIIIALINFLQVRRDIDQHTFYPRVSYVVILTVLAILIGIGLTIYLLLTS